MRLPDAEAMKNLFSCIVEILRRNQQNDRRISHDEQSVATGTALRRHPSYTSTGKPPIVSTRKNNQLIRRHQPSHFYHNSTNEVQI
jgi:hypothetical protein